MRSRAFLVLAIALLISLCLNLFLGGAWVAGQWLERRVEASVGQVLQAYPPSLRRDVARRLIRERDSLRPAVGELRDARQRMFEAMQADPLDRSQLDAAMADVRAKSAAVQERLQAALAASLAETPASERRKIAAPQLGLGLFTGRDP